jgi:hypothetical protein
MMSKRLVHRGLRLGVAATVLIAVLGVPIASQDRGPTSGPMLTVESEPPVREQFSWARQLPTLTQAQVDQLAYWSQYAELPGPDLPRAESAPVGGPIPGTESIELAQEVRGAARMPGNAVQFRVKEFGGSIPALKANNMGSSVGGKDLVNFYTGNSFAARSTDGGATWTYVDPFSGFPEFCCDQVAIYDGARDLFLWLRVGYPSSSGGNYGNVFKISASRMSAANWWTYTYSPVDIDVTWTDNWWNAPQMQLGADWLYISWNIYSQTSLWVRSVMLALSLDDLAAGTEITTKYMSDTSWVTFAPVAGAEHTMYWASNWPRTLPNNSRLRIYKWEEDSDIWSSVERTVDAWTYTNVNTAHCGGPNWTARADQRVRAGARYVIDNDGTVDDRIPGRTVLGWWWNVAEGGTFTVPYIEGAAFYEDTLSQLPGWFGRPYVWGPYCFAYPSVATNARDDLGMVYSYASDADGYKPRFGFSLADDYGWWPPGWTIYQVAAGEALPADAVWGPSNTVRTLHPAKYTWVGAGHIIPSSADCAGCSAPVYVVFGRERDRASISIPPVFLPVISRDTP